MGKRLKDMTYEAVEREIDEKAVLVLPIGGGVKEHGNHLPMGTDYIVTEYIAEEVMRQSDVYMLPTLPYAYFPAFKSWKGSVSIEADHFIAFVKDILLSYHRFGVIKFLIIDGGVSTHIPLMILSATMMNDYGVKLAVTDIRGLGKEVEDLVCTQQRGGHGDESETSCMLHIRPDLVQMANAIEEYSIIPPGTVQNGIQKVYLASRMDTPAGTNGNSTLATQEKGQKILEAMTADIVTFLKTF